MSETTDERQVLIDENYELLKKVNGKQCPSSRLEWVESSWLRCFHRFCFSWIIPILSSGYTRTLTDDDLDQLPTNDKSSILLDKFLLYDSKIPQVVNLIIKIFWKEITIGGLLLLPFLIARMVQPFILRQIILFVDDPHAPSSTGYVYTMIYFVCSMIPAFFFQQSMFRISQTGLRIRHGLQSLIYSRLLSNNNLSMQRITSAQAINLISNDATKFSDSSLYCHFLWESPLEILVGFLLLYWIIGIVPTLCGYFVFMLLIPIQIIFSRNFSQYHETILKYADRRIQILSEMINGCYVIKMNSWEDYAEKQVDSSRQTEFDAIRKASCMRAINMALFFASMPLITLTTLIGIWLTNESFKTIDIFTAISIYGVMRSPVTNFLPLAIEKFVQIRLAIKRIQHFLWLDQEQKIDSTDVDDNQQKGMIIMRNASFSWQNSNIDLVSLNIDIKSGSLVSIMGGIGSGKTAFFAAILGQMLRVHGQFNTSGNSFSYAAQSPWIFADTIRANILLNQTFDKYRYMNVLQACCLDVDMETFGPNGDLTMIGDNGLNLSGGQKARISLARAVYIDADIYLFDDPLASVDNNVAKKIYDQSIGPNGLLRNKTRLLITHQTKYLIDSDQILYFDNGRIRSEPPSMEYQIEHRTVDQIDAVKAHVKSEMLTDMLDTKESREEYRPVIQDENLMDFGVSWSVWYFLFIRSFSGWFVFSLLLLVLLTGQILYEVTNVSLAILLKNINTNETNSSSSILIYITLTLLTFLISVIRAQVFFKVILNGANALEKKMVKGLLNTSIRFYESNPSGRILNRASRDQQIIDEILPTTMFDCIQSLLMTIGSIVIIGIINPWIFLILVPFVGVALLLRHIYMCTNRQLKHLENITRSPVFSLFTTSLNGMMTIRALKIEDYFIQLLLNRIDANTRANLSLIGVSCWFGLLVDLLNNFFLVIVILMSVILKDKIDSSLIVLLLVYMITIKGYFQWGLRQAVETQILMTSAERIYEYGRLPCEEDLRDEHQYIRTPPDWPNRGSIEFRNYSFRYPTNARYALQNFDIHIEPNEKIGIIGRTGMN